MGKNFVIMNTLPHPCSHHNCTREGLYPAPNSPAQPRPFRYFCLEHIREYNAKWDFLHGVDAQEIEKRIRDATVWERPTWPFGKGPVSYKKAHPKTKPRTNDSPPPKIIRSLAALGLRPPCTMAAIKKRYRELAKRFHPDTNRGSNADLTRFHAVQEAFGTLQTFYAKKKQTV